MGVYGIWVVWNAIYLMIQLPNQKTDIIKNIIFCHIDNANLRRKMTQSQLLRQKPKDHRLILYHGNQSRGKNKRPVIVQYYGTFSCMGHVYIL